MKNLFKLFCVHIFLFFGLSTINAQSNSKITAPNLTSKWSTEKIMLTPESVFYCESLDMLFIANINGNPTEKDGNGFISKLSKDGAVIQLKWINGLNAPKGMGVYEGKLYVTDIDELVEIDITSGKILNKYPAKKAKFLNDVAIDKKGTVYVSDSQRNIIFALKKGKFDIWLSVGNLFNPNGLLIDNNELLVGCNNYVLSVNIETSHVRTFITETGSVDGLVKVGNDQYIISDWLGNIHLISKTKPKIKLLGITSENINAADFEYLKDKKTLLVPTFSDNRIMAYEFTF